MDFVPQYHYSDNEDDENINNNNINYINMVQTYYEKILEEEK